ncbi:hypothetical protein INR49_009451 [Caranx melampygus]|nr:hypothetical protein INR49_009451 [Caranx melampygus]
METFSVAGGRGLVLVVCDLRQQDRSSVAAGEEDGRPAARLTGRWCPQRSELWFQLVDYGNQDLQQTERLDLYRPVCDSPLTC